MTSGVGGLRRTPWQAVDFPATRGDVVTEGHAAYCRTHGHAVYQLDGVMRGFCPRCGEGNPLEGVPVPFLHDLVEVLPYSTMPGVQDAAAVVSWLLEQGWSVPKAWAP